MSVTVRQCEKGKWQVDVIYRMPNGERARERRRVYLSSKSAAQRWGQGRERHLLLHGPAPVIRKEVPTLKEFAPRFLDGHARANRHKPSGIAAKETTLRVHLIPLLGTKPLDAITTEDVQRLKSAMTNRAPKTINNTLTVLSRLLKTACEWNVIDRVPCSVRLVKVPPPSIAYHDFENYEGLVTAADEWGRDTYLIVLLGGDAGLRLGEIIALE